MTGDYTAELDTAWALEMDTSAVVAPGPGMGQPHNPSCFVTEGCLSSLLLDKQGLNGFFYLLEY